jgi:hypothetical protein
MELALTSFCGANQWYLGQGRGGCERVRVAVSCASVPATAGRRRRWMVGADGLGLGGGGLLCYIWGDARFELILESPLHQAQFLYDIQSCSTTIALSS